MVHEVHRNRLRRRHLPVLRRHTASALIAATAASIFTRAALAAAAAALASFTAVYAATTATAPSVALVV